MAADDLGLETKKMTDPAEGTATQGLSTGNIQNTMVLNAKTVLVIRSGPLTKLYSMEDKE